MKTGFKILLGIAAVFGIGALVNKKEQLPEPDKNPKLPTGDKSKQGLSSILFVGDSNTFYPWSYADQFIANFPKVRSKKLAKIGVKTDWMLTELKKELAKNKYDVVCILGGSNDIYGGSTVEKAKSNLASMFTLVNKSGGWAIGITPPSKKYFTRRKANLDEMLFTLWDWYWSGWAFKNTGLGRWIDFIEITSDKKYFSWKDGYLHPQKEAHTILLNKLLGFLKTRFK